ncbi:hypothetical protein [Paenibacillus odorifer]|nr:hypothetical protein [Paenibacillus odorifer]
MKKGMNLRNKGASVRYVAMAAIIKGRLLLIYVKTQVVRSSAVC